MSYLVRRHKTDELSHQLIAELGTAGTRIHIGRLQHIPVVKQRHYVMVPSDMALQNLTAARVVHLGSIGISHR